MAVLIDNTDRKLIPSWKSFSDSLPELHPIKQAALEKYSILPFVNEWKEYKNIANAGDLLSAAIVSNQEDIPEVQEAARFVTDNEMEAPMPLLNKAKRLIDTEGAELFTTPKLYVEISKKIAEYKKRLIVYPRDAISHVEISRCYLTLGNNKKAEEHIRCALFLDCNNRYIVRCAARFFVHIDKKKEALDIIRNSVLTKIDPWLMASEISLSQLNNIYSRNLKRGMQLIDSMNYSAFDLSELRASIGTEELMSGAYSKSRRLFNDSLRSPNGNSLAQSRWVSTSKGLALNFEDVDFESSKFIEAQSYRAMASSDYKKAFEMAKKWITLEPYSTRTILYAYNIATNYLDDIKEGVSILKEAKNIHKDNPTILNDLAYSLTLQGEVEEAKKEISRAKVKVIDDSTDIVDICLTATRGMIAFRSGNSKIGSALYEEAIERSLSHKNNPHLNHSAILNYCREVLLFENSQSNRESVGNVLKRVPVSEDNIELKKLRLQVEKLLKVNAE